MSTRIEQTGYQSQSRLSPTAIGGVLLVHLGLGAAILTMTVVTGTKLPETVLETWNVFKEKPKAVAEPQKQPDHRDTRVTTTTTVVPLPDVTDRDILIQPGPVDPVGGGFGPVIDPVLPPVIDPSPPVMVQPKLDGRFAAGFQPPYPAAMLRQQMEGAVTVRVIIGPDGRVVDVALISAADPAFFEATRKQALARWRFVPGTRDGVAITTEKVLTVRFHLTD